MSNASPGTRLRANLTEVVGLLSVGLLVSSFFVGAAWLMAAGLVGIFVVTPLGALLFGDEDDVAEWWGEEEAESIDLGDADETDEDPLLELRRRYARGELTDEAFERKVERLLETESSEDIERYGLSSDDDASEVPRETDVEMESERN